MIGLPAAPSASWFYGVVKRAVKKRHRLRSAGWSSRFGKTGSQSCRTEGIFGAVKPLIRSLVGPTTGPCTMERQMDEGLLQLLFTVAAAVAAVVLLLGQSV